MSFSIDITKIVASGASAQGAKRMAPPSLSDRAYTMKKKKLPRIFRKYGIIAAYLFGSAASGKMHPESDIDIAVRSLKPLSLTKTGLLANELGAIFSGAIDLVDLDNAPLPVQFRVFQARHLLYAKDSKKELMNIVKAVSMYLDSRYYLDRFVNSEIERISHNRFLS